MLVLFAILISQAYGSQTCHAHNHHHKLDPQKIYAVAVLNPDNNSGVSGLVHLVQEGEFTRISAKIHGLEDGLHGFHIHEFGNLIKGCITAGPHYNPHNKVHGGPNIEERHVGDLGNVISKDGVADFYLVDKLVRLDGEYSVIGRSMVVHANVDDLGKSDHPDSKTTGNAGARLACGVIGRSAPFEDWIQENIKQSFKDRSKQLVRLSEIIYNNCDKYAKLITTEMGKPYAQSLAEVKKSAAYCQYYAENGEKFIKQLRIKTEAHHTYVKYEPIGSIYVISPFNFPFWLCFKPIISQLALGNAVIHRPSDSTPLTGLALEELFKESGFNGNEFLNVFSSHDQLEKIVSGCEGVNFTGSSRGGKAIGEIAGRHLKRSVLELGGSDPLMLMLEGNIDKAVDVAIRSRITNSGQVCFSAKRYLIHEVHYDKFKTRLLDRLSKLKIGDPMDSAIDMGPMARMDLVEQLHSQILEGIDQGGNLLVGGELKKQAGFFYPPTVIEVTHDNILAQEETFGPLFPLIKCQDNQQIIDIANRTQFGLGAVLISDDQVQIADHVDKLNCGMVFVNEPVKSDARLPSGGTKQSGFGRECGQWGMMNFANVKTVWIA